MTEIDDDTLAEVDGGITFPGLTKEFDDDGAENRNVKNTGVYAGKKVNGGTGTLNKPGGLLKKPK